MEERGFLSDKFGRYQPEPSPTAWARVQQQIHAGTNLFFWQKAGFLWVSALVLTGGFTTLAILWPNSINSSEKLALSKPKADLIQATKSPSTISDNDLQLFSKSSDGIKANQSNLLREKRLPVANVGSKNFGNSESNAATTYQDKQKAAFRSIEKDYVTNNSGAYSGKGIVELLKEVDPNKANIVTSANSSWDIAQTISPKMAGLWWLANYLENSIVHDASSITKPFARYPISVSFWGGLMMNYYNINPEFSVKSQQLPATLSKHRTGFELGATVAKPFSKRVDGFLTLGLGWHQYKAQFKSTGDSLLGYQHQQGAGQELVYSGKFTDRTYQFNLQSLYMQLSGGLLLRNVAGPASLRLGAGVVVSQIQSETNLISNLSSQNSKSEIGFNAFIGLPFQVNLNARQNLVIEPTVQYFINHRISVPGVATLHPLQLGVRIGFN